MADKFHFTSRTKARKRAVDVVFEADQRGMGSRPGVLFDLLRERKVLTAAQTPLPEYSIFLIEGVASELRRIDRLIEAHLTDRDIDRIPAVDLAAMRVAVWEMISDQADVSAVIAIDEAITIVKAVSTDESPNLVNGVLDAIRKELEAPAWQRTHVTESASRLDEGFAADEVPQPSKNVEELSFAEFAAGLADGDIVPVDETEHLNDLDELLDEY